MPFIASYEFMLQNANDNVPYEEYVLRAELNGKFVYSPSQFERTVNLMRIVHGH